MEGKPERGNMDSAQKAKLIFISVAAIVAVLLVISFVSAGRARSERDAAIKEVEALKQDNAKLSQWLEERTQDLEKHKKALEGCRSKPKPKAAVKKASAKSAKKKTKGKTK